MKPRSLVLLVALLLAAAITWIVWTRRSEPSDSRPDEMPAARAPSAPQPLAPAPAPAGAKPAAPSPAAPAATPEPAGPRVTIRGTTRGPDGEPLAATVYALKKGEKGGFMNPALSTQADADGRWTLSVPAVAGRWIGAVQGGYRPAFADGDRAGGTDASFDLVLQRGRLVTVSVVDEQRKPFAGAMAQAWPRDGVAGAFFPAPDETFHDKASAPTGTDGLALLHLGGSDPITVSALNGVPQELAVYPSHVDLEKPDGRVEFTLKTACHLEVSLLSAETGGAVRDSLQIEVFTDPEGEFAHRSSVSNWQGSYNLGGDALRTGTYRVHVTGAGYRPWRSDPITLKSPGDTAELVARVERDPDLADLVLEVLPAKADDKEIAIDGRSFLMKWRRHEKPNDSWDGPPGGASWDASAHELTLARMPLAAVDLLLWDSFSDANPCAALPNAIVRAGGKNRYTVRLGRGTPIPVERLFGPDETPPAITPRAEGFERLPLVVFFGSGSATFSDSGGSWGRRYTLGPYPFDSLVVSLASTDGSKREVNWPRK